MGIIGITSQQTELDFARIFPQFIEYEVPQAIEGFLSHCRSPSLNLRNNPRFISGKLNFCWRRRARSVVRSEDI